LSGRGLCDELITRPEESYRLCCVVTCDLEISRMGAPYIYDISRLRVNAMGFFFLYLLSQNFSLHFKHAVRPRYISLSKSLTSNSFLLFEQPDDNFVDIFSS